MRMQLHIQPINKQNSAYSQQWIIVAISQSDHQDLDLDLHACVDQLTIRVKCYALYGVMTSIEGNLTSFDCSWFIDLQRADPSLIRARHGRSDESPKMGSTVDWPSTSEREKKFSPEPACTQAGHVFSANDDACLVVA